MRKRQVVKGGAAWRVVVGRQDFILYRYRSPPAKLRGSLRMGRARACQLGVCVSCRAVREPYPNAIAALGRVGHCLCASPSGSP